MDPPQALYAIEYVVSDQENVATLGLVRLSIDREDRLIKGTILIEEPWLIGQSGGHRIALGQFIVTRHGGVIDIQARKVIHGERDGEVLGLEGGKVFYRIDNAFRTSGLFCFDLKELKVAKVERGGHWDLPGLISPDGTVSIVADRSHVGRILLHRPGKAPQDFVVEDRITYSQFASVGPVGVPCFWLDGEHILVGQTNGKLVILTTQGAVLGSIEIKDAPTEIISQPSFRRDPEGKLIYSCGDKDFLVDIPNRVASPLKSISLGCGFEASVAVDQEGRRSVLHDGKAIGERAFEPLDAAVAPGLLAFPYRRPGKSTFESLASIAVWDARVGDWRRIEMRVNHLIGWSNAGSP